jgi:ATP-dependent RNA helicase RhlE
MLDMGFINDIRKIIDLLPKSRQNLMFSATFSKDIRQLAKGLVNDPVEISVTPENSTAKTVAQEVIPVDKNKKSALLISLIKDEAWFQVLVFCRTKHGANKLSHQLSKAGISSAPIHGNKSQGARTRALAEFKKGDLQVLVATDIAARGLDIDQLPQVVNFDLPHVSEDYVHRIGRTGRAGAEGKAVSLVCAAEYKELVGIERLIQEHIPRREVSDFIPSDKLPESPTHLKPIKAKKPKKNKVKQAGDSSRNSKTDIKPAKQKQSSNKQNTNKNNTRKEGANKNGKAQKQTNEHIWGGAAKTTKSSRKPDTTSENRKDAPVQNRQPRKRPVSKPV